MSTPESLRTADQIIPPARVFDPETSAWRTVEQVTAAGSGHVWLWFSERTEDGTAITKRVPARRYLVVDTNTATPILCGPPVPVRCSRCREPIGRRAPSLRDTAAPLCPLCTAQPPLPGF